MSVCDKNSGFALALLLWMIAGMSLMVTAVIHFAQSDIQMAELRLNEAKSRALARGAAFLVLRDYAARASTNEEVARVAAESEKAKPFQREYRLMDGITASATVWSANAYTSLNDADLKELTVVLRGLGSMTAGAASDAAAGILAYRDVSSEGSLERLNFDGFRAREELLAIQGFPRVAYDLVKDFVHPYRTGPVDVEQLPGALGDAMQNDGPRSRDGATGGSGKGGDTSSTSSGAQSGAVTFDAIWEQKRRDALGLGAGESAQPVEVTVKTGSGSSLRQRIWVSGSGLSILRAEPARLSAKAGDEQ